MLALRVLNGAPSRAAGTKPDWPHPGASIWLRLLAIRLSAHFAACVRGCQHPHAHCGGLNSAAAGGACRQPAAAHAHARTQHRSLLPSCTLQPPPPPPHRLGAAQRGAARPSSAAEAMFSWRGTGTRGVGSRSVWPRHDWAAMRKQLARCQLSGPRHMSVGTVGCGVGGAACSWPARAARGRRAAKESQITQWDGVAGVHRVAA